MTPVAGVLLVELDAEDEGVEAQEDDERHRHPLDDDPALVPVHLEGAEGEISRGGQTQIPQESQFPFYWVNSLILFKELRLSNSCF